MSKRNARKNAMVARCKVGTRRWTRVSGRLKSTRRRFSLSFLFFVAGCRNSNRDEVSPRVGDRRATSEITRVNWNEMRSKTRRADVRTRHAARGTRHAARAISRIERLVHREISRLLSSPENRSRDCLAWKLAAIARSEAPRTSRRSMDI